MKVWSYVYAVLALSSVTAGGLDAQRLVRVQAGDRVRIQTLSPSGSFERGVSGTVARVEGDSVLLIDREGAEQQIEVHALDHRIRVQAYTGQQSSIAPGAAIGALLGGAAGAVIGLGFAEECPVQISPSEPTCIEGGREALVGGAIGFGGGLVLGIVAGSLIKRDGWTPVRGFPTVEPALPISSAGAGVRFSIEF